MVNKLVVVPEEVWHHNESIERRKTVYPTLDRMEDEIHRLLEDYRLNDYEKVKLLQQIQQRYKNIYGASRSEATPTPAAAAAAPLTPPPSPPSGDVDTVLTTLPKKLRASGRKVLEDVRSTGNVTWDNLDKSIKIRGIKVEKSDIGKLVRNALKPYSREPHGWSLFKQYLKKDSLPWIETN